MNLQSEKEIVEIATTVKPGAADGLRLAQPGEILAEDPPDQPLRVYA